MDDKSGGPYISPDSNESTNEADLLGLKVNDIFYDEFKNDTSKKPYMINEIDRPSNSFGISSFKTIVYNQPFKLSISFCVVGY